jgi:NADH:ubiquinone oxidoreductase subunit 5 (subunit L)/multisubunit Na+/H+ antiporter MnhA subunit
MAGSASLCALPPFGGFIGEFIIISGMVFAMRSGGVILAGALVVSIALLALAAGIAMLGFSGVFAGVFLGLPRKQFPHKPEESETSMLLPMAVLALLSFLAGIFPQKAFAFILRPVLSLAGGGDLVLPDYIFKISGNIALLSCSFVVLFAVLFLFRLWLLRNRKVELRPTWTCAYAVPNSKMQYSSYSFSSIFTSMAAPLLSIKTKVSLPKGSFPAGPASASSFCGDKLEKYAINPSVRALKALLNRFAWVQSGSLRQYIAYGLIFLTVALVWLWK